MPYPLENLSLLLLYETQAMPLWLERWGCSYPTVALHSVSDSQSIAQWQQDISHIFNGLFDEDMIFIVAHGMAANAAIAWYYQTDVSTQKRIAGIILVSPQPSCLPDDAVHTFQRVRFNQPTALVIAQNDTQCPENWAREYAHLWQARLLIAPQTGNLNHAPDGWQWGMTLMQEMLLSD